MKLVLKGGEQVVSEEFRRFRHPQISTRQEKRVVSQLNETISIYDNSGIYYELESSLEKRFGVRHVLTVNSGTTALFSMFFSLGLQPGDEVIVPDYTFFATATPLFMLGAVPILTDCCPNGNLNPASVREKIGPKTRAIIMTHMWGIPCDIDGLKKVSAEADVPLLEDASHAFGATYKGQIVGSTTTGAALSLQGKKILTAGEGGIFVTNNQEMYERAVLVGHFNKRAKKEVFSEQFRLFTTTGLGLNFRMHPLGAALAMDLLGDIDSMLKDKREIAGCLKKELSHIAGISFPEVPPGAEPAWYTFPILYDSKKFNGVSRDKFVAALVAEGAVEVDIPHSTCPIHEYPIFCDPTPMFPLYNAFRDQLDKNNVAFPEAENFHSRIINFPVWYGPKRHDFAEQYIDAFHKVISLINEL